jgi:hypothetical protein
MGSDDVMIKEARHELAELLGAVPYLPERINPPIKVLQAGNPYIAYETHWDKKATYAITVVVARQQSELANDALDDSIEEVLEALPADTTLLSVEVPFLLEWNGAVYLATKINIEWPL